MPGNALSLTMSSPAPSAFSRLHPNTPATPVPTRTLSAGAPTFVPSFAAKQSPGSNAKSMDLKELSRGFGIEDDETSEQAVGVKERIRVPSEKTTVDHGSQAGEFEYRVDEVEGEGNDDEVLTNPSEEGVATFSDPRRFSMGSEAFGRKMRSQAVDVDSQDGYESSSDEDYRSDGDEIQEPPPPHRSLSRKPSGAPRNPDNWLSGGADAESMLSNPSDEDEHTESGGASGGGIEHRINPDFVFPSRSIRPLPTPPTQLPEGVESAHDSFAHSRETSVNNTPVSAQRPSFVFGHKKSASSVPKLNAFAPEFKPTLFTFQAPRDGPRMAGVDAGLALGGGGGVGGGPSEPEQPQQGPDGPTKRQRMNLNKNEVWLSDDDEDGNGRLGVPKRGRAGEDDDDMGGKGEISPGRRTMLDFKFPPPKSMAGEIRKREESGESKSTTTTTSRSRNASSEHLATMGRSSTNPTLARAAVVAPEFVPGQLHRGHAASAEARHSLVGLNDLDQNQHVSRTTPSKQRMPLPLMFSAGGSASGGGGGGVGNDSVGSTSTSPGARRPLTQFFTPPQAAGGRASPADDLTGSRLSLDDIQVPSLARPRSKAIEIEDGTPVDVSEEEDEVRIWYGCGQCGHCAEDRPESCQAPSLLSADEDDDDRGSRTEGERGEMMMEEEGESEDDEDEDESPSWHVFEQILDAKLESLREELVGATSLRADLDSLKRDALLDNVVQRLEERIGEWVGKVASDAAGSVSGTTVIDLEAIRKLVEETRVVKTDHSGSTRDELVLAIVEGVRDELPLALRMHPEDRAKVVDAVVDSIRPLVEEMQQLARGRGVPESAAAVSDYPAALAEVEKRLAAVLDGLDADWTTHRNSLEGLVAGLAPRLEALKVVPLDTDELTYKLSEAVKPRIIELIDIASDKKETAALITSQLRPEFERLLERTPPPNPAVVDVDAISASVVEAIGSRIPQPPAAVDEGRHDRLRDEVVERVTSRMATLLSEQAPAPAPPSVDVDAISASVIEAIGSRLPVPAAEGERHDRLRDEVVERVASKMSVLLAEQAPPVPAPAPAVDIDALVARVVQSLPAFPELSPVLEKLTITHDELNGRLDRKSDDDDARLRDSLTTLGETLERTLQTRQDELKGFVQSFMDGAARDRADAAKIAELEGQLRASRASCDELEAAKTRLEERLADSEGIRAEQSTADRQHTYQLGQCVMVLCLGRECGRLTLTIVLFRLQGKVKILEAEVCPRRLLCRFHGIPDWRSISRLRLQSAWLRRQR
jgi:hypothetical protein